MEDSMVRKWTVLGFVFLASSIFQAPAHAAANCPDREVRAGTYTIRQMELTAGGPCYVEIYPDWNMELTSRSFSYDSLGMIMVFTSYGDGPEDKMTSAREFYIFPRRNQFSFPTINGSRIRLSLMNGTAIEFDGATERVSAYTGGTFTYNPLLDPRVRGGLELRPSSGIIMDGGYRQGSSPSMVPFGVVEFRDGRGNTCSLTNRDVYAYSANGEPSFKFPTDAQLRPFLQAQCPSLSPLAFEE